MTTMTIAITEEEITAAVEQHARASDAKNRAEKIMAKARVVIEEYRTQNPDAFIPAAFHGDGDESAPGKSVLLNRGEFQTRVTFPESQRPQRVDPADVEDLYSAMMDACGTDFDLFGHTFDLATGLAMMAKHDLRDPETRAAVRIIEQYTKPAETVALAPRITSKEVRRIRKSPPDGGTIKS